MKKFNSTLIFCFLIYSNIRADYKIVGYFANWAQYHSYSSYHFACKPQDLDPTKLTAVKFDGLKAVAF